MKIVNLNGKDISEVKEGDLFLCIQTIEDNLEHVTVGKTYPVESRLINPRDGAELILYGKVSDLMNHWKDTCERIKYTYYELVTDDYEVVDGYSVNRRTGDRYPIAIDYSYNHWKENKHKILKVPESTENFQEKQSAYLRETYTNCIKKLLECTEEIRKVNNQIKNYVTKTAEHNYYLNKYYYLPSHTNSVVGNCEWDKLNPYELKFKNVNQIPDHDLPQEILDVTIAMGSYIDLIDNKWADRKYIRKYEEKYRLILHAHQNAPLCDKQDQFYAGKPEERPPENYGVGTWEETEKVLSDISHSYELFLKEVQYEK